MMQPVAKQTVPTVQASPIRAASDNGQTTILIVDDDPMVTRSLAALVKRAGMKAICFNDAHEAVSAVEMRTTAAAVAAVVLDIHMPRLSGLVVSRRLRAVMGPDVPIVMLSSDASMEMLRALADVGATHFFSKPIKADQLIDHLRYLIQSAA